MIYEVIDKDRFIQRFKDYGRIDQYSYEGLCALWDYLIELYSDQGQDLELDVISLCCSFSEMTKEEFEAQYQGDDLLVIAEYESNGDDLVLVGE